MTPGIEPGILIAVLYISAGIAFTGAVQGIAMIATIDPRSRPFWLYTALSVIVVFLQIEVAQYHTAASLAAAVTAQKWMNAAALVFLPLLFAFIAFYTGQFRIKPWLTTLSIACAGLIAANFLMPFGIRFDHASSIPIDFPWGERLQILRGSASGVSSIVYFLFFGVLLWGLFQAATLIRRGDLLTGAFIGTSLLAVIIGAMATRLEDLGVFRFIYTGGFSFLVFVIFMEIMVSSDLHKASRQIKQLAFNDPLTGLPNRSALLSLLHDALEQARPVKNRVAVLIINMNHFDIINDPLGHDIGDALLLQVSQRLQQQVRESDSVARLGGDEFAVVANELSFTYGAGMLAEKIQHAMHVSFDVGGNTLNIATRIGIAVFPDDGDSSTSLLMDADLAVRHAKLKGHDQVEFFRPEMQTAIRERQRLGNDMRTALAERQFELYYQPQISASNGKVDCVEALIRWNHPRDGLVSPQKFIPIAEETQMIISIGAWVIEEACRNLGLWRRDGIRGVRVAINLSVQQLLQPDLHELVATMLSRHGLKGDDLEFEITESAIMEDQDRSIVQLKRLRALGTKISIDDFGTGYSSLSYLKLLPIDALKIDRSFVTDIAENSSDAMICSIAITLARSLGLISVAEGVETETQAAMLRNMGYDLLQGYLHAKPLPATAAENYIRERNGTSLGVAIG